MLTHASSGLQSYARYRNRAGFRGGKSGYLQPRRQDIAAGGAKNQKGGHILKILY